MSPTPEEWAEARAAWEAGDSARAVAARLGVTHTTVSRRARREGWVVPGDAPRAPRAPGGARREAARANAPEEAPSPDPGELAERLGGGDAPAPLDPSTPEGQRALLRAVGQRSGPELERWLDEEVEYLREQRAERLGYRPLGWIRRAPF